MLNKIKEFWNENSGKIIDAVTVSLVVAGTAVLVAGLVKVAIDSANQESLHLVTFENTQTGGFDSYILSDKAMKELENLEANIAARKAANLISPTEM